MDYYQRSSYRSNRSGKKFRQKPSSDTSNLFLFYILPFIVFNGILFYCITATPKITLNIQESNDYLTTEASMVIESWFPTKSISLNMDGEELEPEKGKRRTYTVPINRNGVLKATVVNINGMSSTIFRHVNILDDNPPAFEHATLDDGILILQVTDSQSLVNPDSVYATDSANQVRQPLSVERLGTSADNTISYELTFEMDLNGLHVFIQDKAGNEAQKTFTTHREGTLDVLQVGADDEEVPQPQAGAGEEVPAESLEEAESSAEEASSETS